MSILNWIVFVAVLCVVYLTNVLLDRLMKKEWRFNLGMFTAILAFCLAVSSVYLSDMYAYLHVKNHVEHHWEERIISVQEVEDVVRSREDEGGFFFGFGNMYESETLRYTVINKDGTRSRKKIYTADCRLMKADKKQKIVYVKNVLVYKNPADEKFFKNEYDVSDGFYKAYVL